MRLDPIARSLGLPAGRVFLPLLSTHLRLCAIAGLALFLEAPTTRDAPYLPGQVTHSDEHPARQRSSMLGTDIQDSTKASSMYGQSGA